MILIALLIAIWIIELEPTFSTTSFIAYTLEYSNSGYLIDSLYSFSIRLYSLSFWISPAFVLKYSKNHSGVHSKMVVKFLNKSTTLPSSWISQCSHFPGNRLSISFSPATIFPPNETTISGIISSNFLFVIYCVSVHNTVLI